MKAEREQHAWAELVANMPANVKDALDSDRMLRGIVRAAFQDGFKHGLYAGAQLGFEHLEKSL